LRWREKGGKIKAAMKSIWIAQLVKYLTFEPSFFYAGENGFLKGKKNRGGEK
jgi:hypothetical protein